MKNLKIETLDEISPYVREHLLPEIKQSVEVCRKSYEDDSFNDMWIFGTHLWKNVWNRFEAVTSFDDCPFQACGKGNEFKLRIGPFVIRHHRINEESKLPNGAKAVKEAAAIQMSLFGDEWDTSKEIDNIVLAIDADTEKGLKEVFIGELVPISLNSNKFKWAKRVPIFLAENVEASLAEVVELLNATGFKKQVPVEEISEVAIRMDSSPMEKERNNESAKDQ